ncbi:MAG: Zinc finger homeobox [Paramarteilia canceri]
MGNLPVHDNKRNDVPDTKINSENFEKNYINKRRLPLPDIPLPKEKINKEQKLKNKPNFCKTEKENCKQVSGCTLIKDETPIYNSKGELLKGSQQSYGNKTDKEALFNIKSAISRNLDDFAVIKPSRSARTKYSNRQLEALNDYFLYRQYPTESEYRLMSKELDLEKRVIVVWFQNSRQKFKSKLKTEIANIEGKKSSYPAIRPPSHYCEGCRATYPTLVHLMQHSKVCNFETSSKNNVDNHSLMDDCGNGTISSFSLENRSDTSILNEKSSVFDEEENFAPKRLCSEIEKIIYKNESTPSRVATAISDDFSDNDDDDEDIFANQLTIVEENSEIDENKHEFKTDSSDKHHHSSDDDIVRTNSLESPEYGTEVDSKVKKPFKSRKSIENVSISLNFSSSYSKSDSDDEPITPDQQRDKLILPPQDIFTRLYGKIENLKNINFDDLNSKRHRTKLSDEQIDKLEEYFKSTRFLSSEMCFELSKSLHLSSRVIQIWFQNRRAKLKRDLMKATDNGETLSEVITLSEDSKMVKKLEKLQNINDNDDSDGKEIQYSRRCNLIASSGNI